MSKKYEDGALLIIETCSEHFAKTECTEETLDELIVKVSELIEDTVRTAT